MPYIYEGSFLAILYTFEIFLSLLPTSKILFCYVETPKTYGLSCFPYSIMEISLLVLLTLLYSMILMCCPLVSLTNSDRV